MTSDQTLVQLTDQLQPIRQVTRVFKLAAHVARRQRALRTAPCCGAGNTSDEALDDWTS